MRGSAAAPPGLLRMPCLRQSCDPPPLAACSGVVLLHQEPPEAAMPTQKWRLYVFKGSEAVGEPLHVHRHGLAAGV